MLRRIYRIAGTVQGVGFRPTLYRLAREAKLGGWIQNRSGTVELALEGTATAIDTFINALPRAVPPNAHIDIIDLAGEEEIPNAAGPFHIKESGSDERSDVTIPADLAMCPECRSEILDPTDRRYNYPFTTCTNCGPRYTVVHTMPYDRSRTTLDAFPLCDYCNTEYRDPLNRRFYAESTACPACGPRVSFERADVALAVPANRQAQPVPHTLPHPVPTDQHPQGVLGETPNPTAPIDAARRALAAGEIVAIRGMGGFHLAIDATNADAIAELRRRKHRPDKPFAVMARDLDAVRRVCLVSDTAADLLTSPEGPIVILDLLPPSDAQRSELNDTSPHSPLSTAASSRAIGRPAGGSEAAIHTSQPTPNSPLPTSIISPDTATLGVMLPTTPLHLLLHEGTGEPGPPPFDYLVMTSGNQSSEPICILNDEARTRLDGIADAFLTHDREINLRNDDSLVAEQSTGLQLWRRARGYAPNPILLSQALQRRVLACGAELKNTIALGDEHRITLSPHIGDLSTPEANDAHERVARELQQFLDRTPQCVAVDLHPDMHCTRHGEALAAELDVPLVRIQHHHAHAAACLGENGHISGLALVFDGTGLGTDETIWGAELLHVDGPNCDRLATFAPTRLPGGDNAVYEPVRQLVARWSIADISPSAEILERCGITEQQYDVWTQQSRQGINAPVTHAAGRLFDALAALLGFSPHRTTYEGQAPIRMEAAANAASTTATLPFSIIKSDLMQIDWSPAFAELTTNHASHWQNADTAGRVHQAIADAATEMIAFGIAQTGQTTVALSGGVFMNRLLCRLLIPELQAKGMNVLTHSRIPPNDGGIAFGQAVIAGRGAEC